MLNKSTFNSFSKIFLLLISLSLCPACARKVTNLESPVTHSPHMTFTIERDYKTTWNATIRAVTDLPGHTIQSSVKRKGTIVVEPVTVKIEGYCDCGNIGEDQLPGPATRTTTIRLKQKSPPQTLVEISCKYSTVYTWKDVYGKVVRTSTIECASSGRFERELHQRVMRYTQL
ncbi:MAG: hypothetical protein JRJ47_14540 [Deltaproteobacteria bacterium]|nr:hypothetical protein [Deltaproteobacteria bacterium]